MTPLATGGQGSPVPLTPSTRQQLQLQRSEEGLQGLPLFNVGASSKVGGAVLLPVAGRQPAALKRLRHGTFV